MRPMRAWMCLMVLAAFAVAAALESQVKAWAPGVPGVSGTNGTSSDTRRFATVLLGADEVPPVETFAFGRAVVRASQDEERLAFVLVTVGLVDTMAAHIHVGPPGVNGPVVAFLFDSGGTPVTRNGLLSFGTITSDDLVGPLEGMTIADLLAEIRNGNAYVNAHTVVNPGGEIRGQLEAIGAK
jgi:hypothetical protein